MAGSAAGSDQGSVTEPKRPTVIRRRSSGPIPPDQLPPKSIVGIDCGEPWGVIVVAEEQGIIARDRRGFATAVRGTSTDGGFIIEVEL